MKKYFVVLLVFFSYCVSEDGAKYIIITPDNIKEVIQPLADWKTQKGIRSKIVKLSDIGNNISQIRNYIYNAYNNWLIRPEYILLVGMGNIMPYTSISDDYFADIIGVGNPLNELRIGRLPCRNAQQCSTIVAKILNYEKASCGIDSSWFVKGTTIICEDGYSPPDSIYWENSRYLHNFWQSNNYWQIDSFSRLRGHNVTHVRNAINNGRAYILYRGSSVFGWEGFNINPDSLNNGSKLPVIVSGTCATMSYIDQGYMGETMLCAGESDNLKGAVGYFGTTVATVLPGLAALRGTVAKGFFRSIFQDSIEHLGDAVNRAKFILDSIKPPYYSDIRYREWNLFGDPSLQLWTAMPHKLSVIHDTVITTEPQTYSVSVNNAGIPVHNAMVCIMKDSTIYEYGYTNNLGIHAFTIYPQNAGVMVITVTAKNFKPYIKNISITPGSPIHDIEAVSIIEPQNTAIVGSVIIPKVLTKNNGNYTETFPVTLQIGNIYNYSIPSVTLYPSDTMTLFFPSWIAVIGNYPISVFSALIMDQWRFNDTINQTFTVVAYNDVGIDTIINPDAYHSLNRTTIPQVKVCNHGINNQSNFSISCSVIGHNGIARYIDFQTISLLPNQDTIINFNSWTPIIDETCYMKVKNNLIGDENPANDYSAKTIIICNQYINNFEQDNGSFISIPLSGAWQWGVLTAGPCMTYSGVKCWGTVLNGNYTNNANWKLTSIDFTANSNSPVLKFWHWYDMEEMSDGGNVKISTDSGNNWTLIGPVGGYPNMVFQNYALGNESCYTGLASWTQAIFYLPVVSGQRFWIRWHFGSDAVVFGPGWYIDDITGEGFNGQFPSVNDVGIDSIIRPLTTQSVNVIAYPIVKVRNYGLIRQTNFSVTCSIFGSGVLRYHDIKNISLSAQMDTILYFNQWYPLITELCTVKMRTGLGNDENIVNDSRIRQCEVMMLLLEESFESSVPPYQWYVYNNDSGTYTWIRGTTYPHSGTGNAESQFESSSLRNDDWLVTPLVYIPSLFAQIQFWYRAHNIGYYESLQVRLSTTDNTINSFTILLDDFHFNNIAYVERFIPINGYAGQNVYIAFINKGLYRRKIYLDDILVKGFTDAIVENEANEIVPVTVLYAIRPNPIKNSLARINFTLADPSQVSLKIFDASGRLVKDLVNEHKNSGIYNIIWNCRDNYNREVAEGVYFYTLETDKQSFAKKMILVK